MAKKRGQLGLDEEKFIEDNIQTLSVEQIAEHLNRSTSPIQRYIDEHLNIILYKFFLVQT
jgi:IS30 family transposase